MRFFALLIALVSVAGPAFGQGAASDQVGALQRFEDGLEHAKRGDLQGAIVAFEAAYAARPHFAVLYNIAQTQSALGRPAQAAETFERYLADGGDQIDEARRREVRALIEANKKRLGSLQIKAADAERTRIWLDGVELTRESLQRPIVVSAGNHTLIHSGGSSYPVIEVVAVAALKTTEVRIASPAAGPPPLAPVAIACRVPGLAVSIDGKAVTTTPIERYLLVASGVRQVRFSRPGYRTTEHSVLVGSDAPARVTCDSKPEPALPAVVRAGLALRTQPRGARVLVDGQAFTGGVLPSGPHELEVEHLGYLPYRQTISLAPGVTKTHYVVLTPTKEKRERDEGERSRRRTLALVLGAVGTTALLTSGGLFLWNQQRYDDWQGGRAGPVSTKNLETVVSIQRVDDVSLGLVVVGASLDAASLWYLLVEPRP